MKSAGMIRKRIGKRIFTGAFCARSSAVGPLPLPELDREVPHDLARRDAHRLALRDRAREHAHARRVDAREEVLERLDEREAHVLLLQRQAHLGRERLLDLRRGEPQRLREAEAGLERDDEEVDQVGQPALDLVAALPRARVDDRTSAATQPSTAAPTMPRTTSHAAAPPSARERRARRTRSRLRRGTGCRAGARASSCTCPAAMSRVR